MQVLIQSVILELLLSIKLDGMLHSGSPIEFMLVEHDE